MKMSATTTIAVPPETVYAFVSDPTNDVHWRKGVTESGFLTDPPLTLGSEGYAHAGKSVARWRVTEFEERSLVTWDLIEGPFQGSGGYRISETASGTEFTLMADIEPTGMMRLLGPLFQQMGTRRNEDDVATLKRLLEGEAVS